MSKKIGVKGLINESGAYKQWALEQRKEFMELRLDQDQDIKEMYNNMSKRITQEVATGKKNKFDIDRLKAVQTGMKDRIDELNGQLKINLNKYINKNVEVGSRYAKQITIDIVKKAGVTRLNRPLIEETFYRMNTRAVEGMWSRSRYGLKLDDHIWNKNKNYRKNINEILKMGVATGEDCVTVARALEKYVKKGKKTFAKDYPNMIARMGKGRIPEDLNYEALRLARTEMTNAYGLGVTKSAQLNPGNNGIRFMLSASHPEYDICDIHCSKDAYGLGEGGYPLEDAPDYPFHPHCGCIITEINEPPEEFMDKMKEWERDPGSQPELEKFYQENYADYEF